MFRQWSAILLIGLIPLMANADELNRTDTLSRAEKCQLFYEELVEVHRANYYFETSLWDFFVTLDALYADKTNKDIAWCMEQLRIDILPSAQPGVINMQPEQSI